MNGILNGMKARPNNNSSSSRNSSRDTSPVAARRFGAAGNSASFGLTKEELRRVQTLNQNMRQMIYKEVRKRPGTCSEKIIRARKETESQKLTSFWQEI